MTDGVPAEEHDQPMLKNTKTNRIRKFVAVVALSAAALAPAAVVTASPASAAACQWDPWTHHCY